MIDQVVLCEVDTLNVMLVTECYASIQVRRRGYLAGMDRGLNTAQILMALREVHDCASEHMLWDVRCNFDLRIADDVVVYVVIRDYELLSIFLAVDFVNVNVVIGAPTLV